MAFAIPQSLGSFTDLKARFDKAKSRKDTWVTHLREAYQYALPNRETFHHHQPGEKKNVTVYDDTAVTGVQKFASRLQSILVPPWRKWSIFVPGSDIPEDKKEEIQEGLDKISDTVFDHINHSNFTTQTHEVFLDVAIGTGALVCNEGTAEDLLEFNAVPLSEIFLEEGPNSSIETVWREHDIKISHIIRLWPEADLSTKMKQAAEKDPEAKLTIIEGSVYDPKGKVYYTLIMEPDEKHLIFLDEAPTSAWIVPRWSTVAGEIYGRGPVLNVLPTIKTLNKVVEFTLRNAALAISGAYTSTDDSVLNPYTARIAPGIIIPVGSNDSRNPSLKALERTGDFNVSELIIENLQAVVKRALFESLREPSDSVISATQFAIEHKELVEDIGGSFGRLQTEFIEKVLKRVVYILSKNGKIPQFKVDGEEITIKHTSPLARAQDNEDLLTFQQFIEVLAPFGSEVMIMGVKVENAPKYLAEKLGVEKEMIRDDVEMKQMQDKVAQIVAAQQQQAQAEAEA